MLESRKPEDPDPGVWVEIKDCVREGGEGESTNDCQQDKLTLRQPSLLQQELL